MYRIIQLSRGIILNVFDVFFYCSQSNLDYTTNNNNNDNNHTIALIYNYIYMKYVYEIN